MSFTTTQIGALTTTVIAAFTTTEIASLTTANIAQMTTAQVPGFTGAELNFLTSDQLQTFTTTQLGAFTSTQVSGMDNYYLRTLGVVKLSCLNVAKKTYTHVIATRAFEFQGSTLKYKVLANMATGVVTGQVISDDNATRGYDSTPCIGKISTHNTITTTYIHADCLVAAASYETAKLCSASIYGASKGTLLSLLT